MGVLLLAFMLLTSSPILVSSNSAMSFRSAACLCTTFSRESICPSAKWISLRRPLYCW